MTHRRSTSNRTAITRLASELSTVGSPRGQLVLHTIILLMLAWLIALLATSGSAQPKGNFTGHTERPLRYYPQGTDFVIENGKEFFNRPLYGTNTAFRVDAGDRPEFVRNKRGFLVSVSLV